MRAINRAIDRFCATHPRFGIPGLMKYIVFVSAVVFILNPATNGTLQATLSFSPTAVLGGQVWRIITWIFIPLNNNVFFTAIMLFFYFSIGSTLEREWGTPKFTIFYLFGVLLNVIYGFLMGLAFNSPVGLVANYLNLSMFFAFAALFPDHKILLLLIIPVKIKWLALANAFFFAYIFVVSFMAGRIAAAFLPLVAILNFIMFCGYDVMAYLRPRRARYSSNAINFQKASRKAKRDSANKPYRHKCAVCGKTDTEYPELEFRYCSRCNGYHCFCLEHINNHIHFK